MGTKWWQLSYTVKCNPAAEDKQLETMASLFVWFGEVIYISMQQSDVFGGEKVVFFLFCYGYFFYFYFLNTVAPLALGTAQGFRSFVYGVDWTMFHVGGQRAS